MNTSPETIITDHQDGLLDRDQAIYELEQLQVRGAFRDDGSYIGYDYRNQEWIEVSAPGEKS